jgi:nitronate monooxygenase
MAGAAAGELAAAVCHAGGLGMIGAGAVTPEWISEQCKIASSAGRPFGVGLLAWLLADNPGQLDAVLATAVTTTPPASTPARARPCSPGSARPLKS